MEVISMDNKALYKLEYGVFMVATSYEGKSNGCITNTCIQVASSPTRVALSMIKTNYTPELIMKSRKATISILSKDISFDTLKHFGMQSGRDVDKMSGIDFPMDDNGIPYLGWSANAVLSVDVLEDYDLGSHYLFICEVKDAKVLSDAPSLTYNYYQSDIKPKPQVNQTKKIIGWRCKICGYEYKGSELPDDFSCPLCGHPKEDFEPIYE